MDEIPNKNSIKQTSSNLFPVAGIGASAGGLEAFKRLIKAIPENSGIAYVLVQHLAPAHESLLADILQKITYIPVHEITNNVKVEPDNIYIIPSNKLLTANDGLLQLEPRPAGSEKNMPIDIFFTSLAEVHQSHAIGVILSGTATDGTLGLKAIKDQGGITFAQDQQTAAFNGMPQSAIDAEVVDFILAPEEIAIQLAVLSKTYKNSIASDNKSQLSKEESFKQILTLMRVRKGTDFTYYKQTTVRRRIVRRMGLNKIEDIQDYHAYLKKEKTEQDILYQDLLIPVTDFFRDPKTYDYLCAALFPALIKGNGESNTLRIWSAGCSTGQEPYSIAICLHEYMEEKSVDFKIQLFATDISEKSIIKARSGIYTKKDLAGLSAQRLQKYFTKINGSYQVNKFIRDACVFACHNFLQDPPFAKIDFISCRNVLIYLETFLQKKALTTFHYALKDSGHLLLGKSETTGPAADLFMPVDKNEKLYTRKNIPGKFLPASPMHGEKTGIAKRGPAGKGEGKDNFQKIADDVLLSRYSPPGVVVNMQMEIVQFRGSTGTWLEPSPGKPSLHILKMAKEGLAFELRNALHKSKADNKVYIKENIFFQSGKKREVVSIEVIPLLNLIETHFLILFKNPLPDSAKTGKFQMDVQPVTMGEQQHVENIYIKKLENELAQVREDMRGISEDQEAANEELQSANEELLSGSEELQSLNEELETSKEEIQSTNEELTSLNQELIDRNEQLNLSTLYAESIVATVREPLIILDKNMKVRTANKSYYSRFNTTEEDTEGKLFHEISNGLWDVPALRSMLENILIKHSKITDLEVIRQFPPLGERVMMMNASRILRTDHTEQLILLAIEDVTEKKKQEHDQQMFTHELEKRVTERTASLRHSNENLEQFATIASHDLQEPLRKIMTFANLLKKRHSDEVSAETHELLDKINLSAGRMSTLIKDVLHFSKILDSDKAFEQTDLGKVLANVLADFNLLITQKEAIIEHNKLPVIEAIPFQMNQLVYNLLSNALKFTRDGVRPKISIKSKTMTAKEVKKFPNLQKNTTHYEIILSDNGIGFEKEFSEQVFLIFQRLNSREHFDGTGIGLALCKKVVINHRGEIFADSVKGKGTRFHIILPRSQQVKHNS